MSRAVTLPEVVTTRPTGATLAARAADGPSAILTLMAQAVEKGIPVEAMQTLQQMYHAEQDRTARLEFAAALARFQETCPPVPASAELEHLARVDRNGVKRVVRFATIQAIRDHMQPYLTANGFSVSLDAETDGDMLTGIATLRHVNGHSTSSRFKLPTAAKTPAMSPQQTYEAAYSFACRIALRSVTGVRVASDDPASEAAFEAITDEQAVTLDALRFEVGADLPRFLKFLSVPALSDLPAARYKEAVEALEAKRRGK